MDTYSHDDMHHQYGKNGNYNNISMMMNCGPKKVKFDNLTEAIRFFLLLLIVGCRLCVLNDFCHFKCQFNF
jgi:hypothetical protein